MTGFLGWSLIVSIGVMLGLFVRLLELKSDIRDLEDSQESLTDEKDKLCFKLATTIASLVKGKEWDQLRKDVPCEALSIVYGILGEVDYGDGES